MKRVPLLLVAERVFIFIIVKSITYFIRFVNKNCLLVFCVFKNKKMWVYITHKAIFGFLLHISRSGLYENNNYGKTN